MKDKEVRHYLGLSSYAGEKTLYATNHSLEEGIKTKINDVYQYVNNVLKRVVMLEEYLGLEMKVVDDTLPKYVKIKKEVKSGT